MERPVHRPEVMAFILLSVFMHFLVSINIRCNVDYVGIIMKMDDREGGLSSKSVEFI